MKKIGFLLTIWVVVSFAVEWGYEKIYDQTEMNSHGSEIVLDGNGNPYILYSAGESEYLTYILRLAKPDSGGWGITDIDTVPVYKLSFSFDVNPDNDVVIAYTDTVIPGISDIYLAIYHEGAFDFVNLTDNWVLKLDPIVQVGSDGIVRLVYLEFNGNVADLRYGWYDGETFVSESIRDSMESYQYGFDFCLDADNQPHVFFIGDDYNLWHATRAGVDNWTGSTLGMKGYHPSVAMDKDGYFHIGCEDYPNLSYLTNASGSWTQETVAESEGEMDWVFPTIALDPQGIPHMIWYTWIAPYHNLAALDIWFSSRTDGSWSEPEPLPPDKDKALGDFQIDSKGYGHVCYSIYDLYYAKTTEPLSTGITEPNPPRPPQNPPLLMISGSSVRFDLSQSSFVSLKLYDACGSRVEVLTSGHYLAGEHLIPLNTAGFALGVYFVKMDSGLASKTIKFLVTK